MKGAIRKEERMFIRGSHRSGIIEAIDTPPFIQDDRGIDFDHLVQVTGGDRKTMQELLRLFDLNIDMLLALIASEEPRIAAARAHTLAASARAIGAWNVADAATMFERLALRPGPLTLSAVMNQLSRAATEAQIEIKSLLEVFGSAEARAA